LTSEGKRTISFETGISNSDTRCNNVEDPSAKHQCCGGLRFRACQTSHELDQYAWSIFITKCCRICHSVTKFRDWSPYWKPKISSAAKEICRILRNPKFHCCVHKGPPLVAILSHSAPIFVEDPYLPIYG